MKKLFLLIPALTTLSSCAYFDTNKPEEELYIDIRTPHIQDINFNETGDLPKDIQNQKYYDVRVSGSAIENCDVVDYGDAKIRHEGKNKIFIGQANDWDVVRIDCRKYAGKGKSKETHGLEIKVFSNDKIYHGKTQVEHE
ncbi:hypothetical protein LO80_03025 [Candidatus Francisella endociliophora]|uniref:Lipoprotein n=1 Tax=Candidatus Francisella endociliophora TaxID=653937 RepID=A0A097ENB0_9GAMM|nr:hypothetical protein [Francisella sp. FSC1006]AIT09049.1 hypothetical protein LO80_03025 [Francisella sp. FSC1006]